MNGPMPLTFHPLADVFPLLEGAAFAELVDDVAMHGVREPITLHAGQILDGRNRWRAAQEAGVPCPSRMFDGDDPAAFVVSLNLTRRHLNESQRAMVAARLATLRKGRPTEENASIDAFDAPTQHAAAELLNVSRPSVQRARQVVEHGADELKEAVDAGKVSVAAAADLVTLRRDDQVEAVRKGPTEAVKKAKEAREARAEMRRNGIPVEGDAHDRDWIELDRWKAMSAEQRGELLAALGDGDRHFNKQDSDAIEWARWSWNPVTGCRHDCSYCYARDIAARFYPQGFQPSFYPRRLSSPANTKVPAAAEDDISYRNVFTCSMADLFGRWVPDEWIEAVLDQVRENPQWNFLFLTKFPKRMAEFRIPRNAWMGTTVDLQARVKAAEAAFARVDCEVKWLSIEPMLQPLEFSRLELFDWVVIGGSSRSSQTPEWVPPLDWMVRLHTAARAAGCRIYYKSNAGMSDALRIKEFPWGEAPEEQRLPSSLMYLGKD